MIQFIGVNNSFVNLGVIAVVDDVTETAGHPIAQLTTITGELIEIDGPEAEAIFRRCELISAETEAAAIRMHNAVAEIEAMRDQLQKEMKK